MNEPPRPVVERPSAPVSRQLNTDSVATVGDTTPTIPLRLTLADTRAPAIAVELVRPRVRDVCAEQQASIIADAGFLGDTRGVSERFGAAGLVRESAGHADTRIANAPAGARVTLGAGDITIDSSAGEVFALTGGGSINITASGPVIATTGGGGQMAVTFTGGGAHYGEIAAWGPVTLTVPDDISAVIVA